MAEKKPRWSLDNFFRYYEPSNIYPRGATFGSESSLGLFDWKDDRLVHQLLELPSVGEVKVGANQFRPDLISLDALGSIDYWGILLMYNNILSIEELVPAKSIKYPSQEDLEQTLFRAPNPEAVTIPTYVYDESGRFVRK